MLTVQLHLVPATDADVLSPVWRRTQSARGRCSPCAEIQTISGIITLKTFGDPSLDLLMRRWHLHFLQSGFEGEDLFLACSVHTAVFKHHE